MTIKIDVNAGETPFSPLADSQVERAEVGEFDAGALQEINDRRAREESAETLRLVRAL